MKELIKRIKQKITYDGEDSLLLETPEISPIRLKQERFKNIKKTSVHNNLIFIDGGNLEIIKSPSLSLFFNRIYYVIYKDNKRLSSKRHEFFTLIFTEEKKGKITYKTENYFPKEKLNLSVYVFDSFDKTLTRGNNRVPISIIGDITRRFSELEIARQISEEGIIIIDGSLEPKYTYEKDLLKKLLDKKVVCGFSKTTQLLTKKGDSASAHLGKLTDKKSWYYDVGTSNLYLAKLHSKSDYVFRVEINVPKKVDEIFSLLKSNSQDPIFLGYPYGLVEADRFALVSNKERETLQIQLRFLLKKDFEKIKPYLHSVNAHEILDSIS